MSNKIVVLFSVFVLGILLVGCSPRNINILQANTELIKQDSISIPPVVIQKGDLLFIGVNSQDPQSDLKYNITNYYTTGTQTTPSTNSVLGYLVNREGKIKFPDMDEIKVEGLKTMELESMIKNKLETYLKSPIVTVRMLNFRVSVLGEVAKPGTFQIPSEKVSIIEALGLAGDMTVYSERDKVMVVREINGKREYGWLDMTKGDLFRSPYYYLQQNDAVYVYASRKKAANIDMTTVRNISLVTGIVSAAAILITALSR